MELLSLKQENINIDELLEQIVFFEQLSSARKKQLKKDIEFIKIKREEILMCEGDKPDYLYLVYSGRLIVYKKGMEEDRLLGVIGQGEMIGEMALFDNSPRSASIKAVRQSILLRISNEKLRKLMLYDAELILKMFTVTSARMKKMLAKEPTESLQSKIQIITVIPAGLNKLNDKFLTLFNANLSEFEKSCCYNEASFKNLGNVKSADSSQAIENLRILSKLEQEYPLIILTCDGQLNDWSLFCLQNSDCFLFVAQEDTKQHLNQIEQYVADNLNRFNSVSKQLICLHSPNISYPSNTAHLIKNRPINSVQHGILEKPETIKSMVRILLNRAHGLVLSGGGVFGLAHLGVIQALKEKKIPIDVIGGVSVGAIIAAIYAQTLNINETIERFYTILKKSKRKQFFLWQIPVASLIKPAAAKNFAKELLEDIAIEDLWIPFFCLACNLTTTHDAIFDKGSLINAVIASNSLPGMLSPILINGELFVDGGVTNTMPADIMKKKFGGTVYAVNVSQKRNIEIDKVHKNFPSTFEILANKLNPFTKYPKVPYIPEILTRSIVIGNKRKLDEVKTLVDFLIEPDFSSVNGVNYSKINQIIEIGYNEAMKVLEKD